MRDIIDLDRYPLDKPGSTAWNDLVARARTDLEADGMFNLDGFLRDGVAAQIAAEMRPLLANTSFEHKRLHNIYFKKSVEGVPPTHPALAVVETVSHTVCADQIGPSQLTAVYECPGLAQFLAEVMGKPALYPMEDALARLNVMGYRPGEALNWHFDRSEFTTTLLLQEPSDGGVFEYRTNLRSEQDPNYDGVARLLRGDDPDKASLRLKAGALNVFRGKNTAHRVTPVQGGRDRIVAVFSFYERPGVQFSAEERLGFYGRAA